MSAAVLQAAEYALKTKSLLSDENEGASGNLKGRRIRDWAFKLFIAGSVVGAIAAIAGFALSYNVIGVIGFFLCLTSGFAAFYTRRYQGLNTLEGYTKKLSSKVTLLAAKTLELDQENKELKKISLGIKSLPDSWKKEIQKGKKQLKEKTEALEKATSKLKIAQKRLNELAEAIKILQKQTGGVSKEVLSFTEENGLFGGKLETLKSQVGEFEKENEELLEHIKNLDEQNDQTEEVMRVYEKNNKIFEGVYKMLKEMYLSTKQKMEELKKEVNLLKEAVPEAVASSNKAEEVAKNYQEMVERLDLKLHKLKMYKEGYEKWEKWVNSSEYSDYLAWRKKTKRK